jgi:hypothetical protein
VRPSLIAKKIIIFKKSIINNIKNIILKFSILSYKKILFTKILFINRESDMERHSIHRDVSKEKKYLSLNYATLMPIINYSW